MKVFISYSSKDRKWVKEWLLPRLEEAGVETYIDYRDFKVGVPSVVNIEEGLTNYDKTLLILTPNWVESEWTAFEAILLQSDDLIGKRETIMPLMLEKCELPKRLKIFTYADFKDKFRHEEELNRLLNQWGVKKKQEPPLEKEVKVSLDRMPETMTPRLLGRDNEMKSLDEAWQDHRTRIVKVIAWGGVGKTTLTNHWLINMKNEGFRGAGRVYAWSFYSQGSSEGRQGSADAFITEALNWFGDDQAEKESISMTDRARRLAQRVQEENALLVLDGLEPLQYPEKQERGLSGRLKDNALKTLLKCLANGNGGMCLITSRQKLTDLEDFTGDCNGGVRVMNLEHLDTDAGVELLKMRGAKGRDIELEEAVLDHKGHALALTLLGRYVKEAFNGDIRQRDKIQSTLDEDIQGAHARHVMASYETWLKGRVELDILYLMGLFDRPAAKGALEALRQAPIIEGLTEGVHGIGEARWNKAISKLRGLGLLDRQNSLKPEDLDCHPSVREYFGEKLEYQNEKGFRVANERLYEYYKGVPKKWRPDTLEEMEPLFAAIAHGCRAGKYMDVWENVYELRIQRINVHYMIKKLGAFGADLTVLWQFFLIPWNRLGEDLTDRVKLNALIRVAFRLRSLGRLSEAEEPLLAGLQLSEKSNDSENKARITSSLSELKLMQGKVAEAIIIGKDAIRFADQSKHDFIMESNRTVLADALHQAGHLNDALLQFNEAEELKKKRKPKFPFLNSLQGYRYCDLLLGLASVGKREAVSEVINRSTEASVVKSKFHGILANALNNLALGQSLLNEEQTNTNKDDRKRVLKYLDFAVEELRKSGYQYYMPLGLLARAGFFWLKREFENARIDLGEAREIAEAGEMRLHLADYHLEECRLNLDLKDSRDLPDYVEKAREHLRIAEEMIKEMGYGRRKPEVERLKMKLKMKNEK